MPYVDSLRLLRSEHLDLEIGLVTIRNSLFRVCCLYITPARIHYAFGRTSMYGFFSFPALAEFTLALAVRYRDAQKVR